MTKKETVNRNIGLTFDFIRQAVKGPALPGKIPDGSVLEFVAKDFAKKEKNDSGKKKLKKKISAYTIKVRSNLICINEFVKDSLVIFCRAFLFQKLKMPVNIVSL